MSVHELNGIASLGINTKEIVFQIVNFAILLLILKLTAYKPIIAALEKRRQLIEQSIKRNEEIEQSHQRLEKQSNQILSQAQLQVQKMIKQATDEAAKFKQDGLDTLKREQALERQKNAARLAADKESMIKEARRQIAQLVVATTQKILTQSLNQDDQVKIIKRALDQAIR